MTKKPKDTKELREAKLEIKLDSLFQMFLGNGTGSLQLNENRLFSEVLTIIHQERERWEKSLYGLIAKEIVIAQLEGQPTSRLTSLAVKLKK